MRILLLRLALASVLCGCGLTLSGQAWSEGEAEHAERLLAQMTAALGGHDSIANLRSLSVAADCTGPGGDFKTWVQSQDPDMTFFRQLSERGEGKVWRNGSQQWSYSADQGYQMRDPGVASFIRGHEFHYLILRVDQRFSDHQWVGADSVAGRPCQRLSMLDEQGKPATLCISDDDHFPLQLTLNPEGAEGDIRIQFQDWRRIQGIEFFHFFRLEEGSDRVFTYRYTQIEPNALIDPEQFQVPDQLLD